MVDHYSANLQSFRYLKMMWKDEDEDANGLSIGPLYLLNEAGDAVDVDDTIDSGSLQHRSPKWLTLNEAAALANRLGFELEVF